jgi:hypothetical protein
MYVSTMQPCMFLPLSSHACFFTMPPHACPRQPFCSSHTLSQPASPTQPSLLLVLDFDPKMAFDYCLKTYKSNRGLSNHQSRMDCIEEFQNAILRRGEEQAARVIKLRCEEEQMGVVQGDEYTTCEGINVEPSDEFPSSGQPSSPQEAQPWHPRATRPRRVKRTIHFDSFPPPPPPPTELLEPSSDPPPDDEAVASNGVLADEEVAIEEESDLDLGRPTTMATVDQQGIILSVSPHDQVMACLYKLCDDAGAPKYLCDDLVSVIREKMVKNNFNILSPAVSKRRTFSPGPGTAGDTQPRGHSCNLGVFWRKSYRL